MHEEGGSIIQNILLTNKWFKEVNVQLKQAAKKLDTTGHSIGGALATHLNWSYPNQVKGYLSVSWASSCSEPFHKQPQNKWDYSHKRDSVSLSRCKLI